MLHLVRANSPYTVIILFILTLGLKLQALGHPIMPVAGNGQVMFALLLHFLHRIWGDNALAYTLFATVCVFGQALYLRFISIRHRLFPKNSYLPAFIYIVLSSLHPRMGHLTSTLMFNWILIAGIDMMLGFSRREDQPRTIFNAGFLLALAALMDFPSLLLFLLLIYSLAVLRVFRPGEWIVGILGYLTPFYFAVCIAYLWNQMPELKFWPQFGWNLPVFGKGHFYAPLLIGSAIFLLGAGTRYLSLILPRLTVSTKRGWGVLAITGIIAALVCTLAKSDGPIRWMSTLPVCSLFIVPALMPEKRSGFATFTFYFLIAFVLFCQLALNHNVTS